MENHLKHHLSPPWPSGLKRWNQTLVPVVRARFEPRCGRPHFAPTRSGVRVCGRNSTEAREREWGEGTVSSLPGTLNVRIKFCHSTGIAHFCCKFLPLGVSALMDFAYLFVTYETIKTFYFNSFRTYQIG